MTFVLHLVETILLVVLTVLVLRFQHQNAANAAALRRLAAVLQKLLSGAASALDAPREILPIPPTWIPPNGTASVSLIPSRGMFIDDILFPSLGDGNLHCVLDSLRVRQEEMMVANVDLSALTELSSTSLLGFGSPRIRVEAGDEIELTFRNRDAAAPHRVHGVLSGLSVGSKESVQAGKVTG